MTDPKKDIDRLQREMATPRITKAMLRKQPYDVVVRCCLYWASDLLSGGLMRVGWLLVIPGGMAN